MAKIGTISKIQLYQNFFASSKFFRTELSVGRRIVHFGLQMPPTDCTWGLKPVFRVIQQMNVFLFRSKLAAKRRKELLSSDRSSLSSKENVARKA